ncbi:MAG: class II aldolase/adducin family protein [Niveispirillum sp.]|nr:class II aldolase/adducin family protein [Niveispirillum sp.]
MTDTVAPGLTAEQLAFVTQAQKDARKAFRVLRETRTISPSGTLGFTIRIPDSQILVNLNYAGPWGDDLDEVKTSVVGFDGTVYLGKSAGPGGGRYTKLFRTHDDVVAISHVHTPNLGAYSQAHAELPLLYVPNRRFRKTASLPVYINRRQPEVDFILDSIAKDTEVPGIIEANGGATVWSKKGIIDLANTILFLEEGAHFQILAAAALGGSKPFGPGVLQQQWRMGGLIPSTATVDDDGTIHLAAAE